MNFDSLAIGKVYIEMNAGVVVTFDTLVHPRTGCISSSAVKLAVSGCWRRDALNVYRACTYLFRVGNQRGGP